jgi:two-component system, NtrC family, sensor histidine kinase KinB
MADHPLPKLRTRLSFGMLTLLVVVGITSLGCIKYYSDLDRVLATLPDEVERTRAIHRLQAAAEKLKNHSLAGNSSAAEEERVRLRTALSDFLQHSQGVEKGPVQELLHRLSTFLSATTPQERGIPAELTIRGIQQLWSELQGTMDEIHEQNQQGVHQKITQSHELLGRANYTIFLAMLLAITLSLYASHRLARGVVRPIQRLTTSMQQMSLGKYTGVSADLPADELRELVTAFNEMAAQLQEYRNSASERILKLHKTMQTTLASFPDPIFVLSRSGSIEFRNPSAEDFAAKLLKEGRAGLPPVVDEKLNRVLATGADYLPTHFKDALRFQIRGDNRFFLPRILTLKDEREETFGVAIILEDVTNLRLLDDMKTNLVATVSHELKTPLSSLRLSLHLLQEQLEDRLTTKQARLLDVAREDMERLLRTLNNLLDLSRMEDPELQLQKEKHSIETLIQDAIEQTRNLAQTGDVEVMVDLGEDPLPLVLVDRPRCLPILSNFLSNAIKYSPPGTRVVVRASQISNQHARISVLDSGPGIQLEYQHRIFERFFRIPGQDKSGAGLGLSIARDIARLHGSEVGLISTAGHGSEFYVDLLCAESQSEMAEDEASKGMADSVERILEVRR